MSIKKYSSGQWIDIPYRKYGTETETLTNLPADIIADGQSASADIIGNMVQTGTPTPQNPIQPSECGDLETTGEHTGQYKIPISSGGVTTPVYLGEVQSERQIKKLVLTGTEYCKFEIGTMYTIPVDMPQTSYSNYICSHYQPAYSYDSCKNTNNTFAISKRPVLFISDNRFSTATELKTWLAQQYSAGTPVTVWYVLATPQTTTLNEPIRKIGNYADSVSVTGIPTTGTAESFDIDTTLKPSEVDLTYHGWHEHSDTKFTG